MTRERAIELLEFKRTKLKFDPGTGEPDTFADWEDAELYDALLMAIKDMELIREALIVGFNGEEVVFHDSGMAYAIYGKQRKKEVNRDDKSCKKSVQDNNRRIPE